MNYQYYKNFVNPMSDYTTILNDIKQVLSGGSLVGPTEYYLMLNGAKGEVNVNNVHFDNPAGLITETALTYQTQQLDDTPVLKVYTGYELIYADDIDVQNNGYGHPTSWELIAVDEDDQETIIDSHSDINPVNHSVYFKRFDSPVRAKALQIRFTNITDGAVAYSINALRFFRDDHELNLAGFDVNFTYEQNDLTEYLVDAAIVSGDLIVTTSKGNQRNYGQIRGTAGLTTVSATINEYGDLTWMDPDDNVINSGKVALRGLITYQATDSGMFVTAGNIDPFIESAILRDDKYDQ